MTFKITFLCKTKPKIGFNSMQFGAFTSSCWRQCPFKCQPYLTLWWLVYTAFAYCLFYDILLNIISFCFIWPSVFIMSASDISTFTNVLRSTSFFITTILPLHIQFYFASNTLPDITIRWLSTSSEVHKYILITKRYRNYERLKNSSSK